MLTPHFLNEEDSDQQFLPGYGPAKKLPVSSGASSSPESRQRIRVLLVEDNAVDARLVQLSLKRAVGTIFEVVTEATVTKAVAHLSDGGFQVVLLDLELPDSSGLNTFLRIRDHAKGIPVIVLTGNADEELGVKAIQQGASEYLVKGSAAATLTRTIRYAISRHRLRRKVELALESAKLSEANQRMLIEKNLDGIVVVNHEGRMVHANPAAKVLLAYPDGELTGQPFPLPVMPGSTQETDIVTFESEIVPIELRFGTIDWNGQPATLVLIRDLTERRLAESNRHKLELAREVQRGLLPHVCPQRTGFDIAGASITTDETGGDYFDYVAMPDGVIGLVVADASGHGIAAAMLISVVSAYLRAFGSQSNDPGEVLRQVSQLLAPRILEGSFVTAVLACVDPVRRTVKYASAGHPSALLMDASGQVRTNLTSLDLPIGLDPDCQFQSSGTTSLQPGDTLVLVSDGILEAMRQDDSLFGKSRVIELVRQHRHETAQKIVTTLMIAVRDFCAPQSPADDLTVVVLKVV